MSLCAVFQASSRCIKPFLFIDGDWQSRVALRQQISELVAFLFLRDDNQTALLNVNVHL